MNKLEFVVGAIVVVFVIVVFAAGLSIGTTIGTRLINDCVVRGK